MSVFRVGDFVLVQWTFEKDNGRKTIFDELSQINVLGHLRFINSCSIAFVGVLQANLGKFPQYFLRTLGNKQIKDIFFFG